jgi:hypothetical protein
MPLSLTDLRKTASVQSAVTACPSLEVISSLVVLMLKIEPKTAPRIKPIIIFVCNFILGKSLTVSVILLKI